MATVRQKIALEALVGSGGNVTKAMRKAGYKENTINTPTKLTQSKGFLELADSLGLTDDLLTRALVADIKGKPKKREKELRLAFQVRGRLKENVTPPGTTNNFLIIGGDQLKRIASRVLDGNTEGEAEPGGLSDSDKS